VFKVIVTGIRGRVEELTTLTQEPNSSLAKKLKCVAVACMSKNDVQNVNTKKNTYWKFVPKTVARKDWRGQEG
jgi:hypothetical protein